MWKCSVCPGGAWWSIRIFQLAREVPQHGWCLYIFILENTIEIPLKYHWNTIFQWMITGGTTTYGTPPFIPEISSEKSPRFPWHQERTAWYRFFSDPQLGKMELVYQLQLCVLYCIVHMHCMILLYYTYIHINVHSTIHTYILYIYTHTMTWWHGYTACVGTDRVYHLLEPSGRRRWCGHRVLRGEDRTRGGVGGVWQCRTIQARENWGLIWMKMD